MEAKTTMLDRSQVPSALFLFLGFVILGSIFAGILMDEWLIMAFPLVLFIGFLSVVDIKKVWYLLMAAIPLSIEFLFPNGFGTDLPTEPMMVGLTAICVLYILSNGKNISKRNFTHPLTLFLLLHLAWIAFSMLYTQQFLFSLKFFLAKIWYLAAFYVLPLLLIKTEKDVKNLIYIVLIPLLLVTSIIMVRHFMTGFAFDQINFVVGPFFRNHVSSASTMVLFTPFVWCAFIWTKRGSFKRLFLIGGILLLASGVYFSYTRAAYVALMMGPLVYWIVRFKLMKWVLAISLITATLVLTHLIKNEEFLNHSPNFETTISHQRFDNLMSATYKMEDISTMERVYRWVAGYYMVKKHPSTGVGPGNFSSYYQQYSVRSFKTYVSDNPEKSGIHSYYLMSAVEQGIIGVLIFVALLFFSLIYGQKVYHRLGSPASKRIVMACIISLSMIAAILLINDMVETDKVGSFFFLSLALIAVLDIKSRPKGHDPLS